MRRLALPTPTCQAVTVALISSSDEGTLAASAIPTIFGLATYRATLPFHYCPNSVRLRQLLLAAFCNSWVRLHRNLRLMTMLAGSAMPTIFGLATCHATLPLWLLDTFSLVGAKVWE